MTINFCAKAELLYFKKILSNIEYLFRNVNRDIITINVAICVENRYNILISTLKRYMIE